jgi:CRP-like cAMP-binding protein
MANPFSSSGGEANYNSLADASLSMVQGGSGRSGLTADLGSVPFLSRLSQSQLDEIAAAGSNQTFRSGETIVRQGEKGLKFYVILSGTANVRRSGHDIASLFPGQCFGEAALLVDHPRTADVLAITDVTCFVIHRWDFWKAVGIDPESNRALFDETVRRLRSFTTELAE